ncbi:MAG: hypothetical protein ABIR91_01895, partial [Candidatus Saccharimonadales bacterium]
MKELAVSTRVKKLLDRARCRVWTRPGFIVFIVGLVAAIMFTSLYAVTTIISTMSSEAESGTRVGDVARATDTTASGGAAVKFGAAGAGSQAALCDGMQNWSSAASWGGAGVPV